MSLNQFPSKHCECSPRGRNLIVCIDGTSNQFGAKNTNVIEIYSQLVKSGQQLTYYNSGIGTYAKPSWSWSYLKQAVDNTIDLAIAWNFERIVLAAYRWLSDNYKDGDRIYLFGFSRGAYQVRTLAGMIQKVGLVYKGNDEQIPFAYELYADQNSDKFVPPQPRTWSQLFHLSLQPTQSEPIDLAQRFKSTFSREKVSIHFVGVWDTVSSVGIVRGKTLPLTGITDHVCFFRHALALDERRVKFLPEYAIYGKDKDPVVGRNVAQDHSVPPPPPHIKEVWFPGTHSDIGGGNQLNINLDLGRTPGLWMMSEAINSGLLLRPKKVEWDWQNLDIVKESLTSIWRLFEWIPFKRLSYEDSTSTTYSPHWGEGRAMKPGQKIHASVAFCKPTYRPKACLSGAESLRDWAMLVSSGGRGRIDWAKKWQHILEMDIFDHEAANNVVNKLTVDYNDDYELWLHHLAVMVWTYEGCVALMSVDNVVLRLTQVLKDMAPSIQVRILDALYTCHDHELLMSLSNDVFDILMVVICREGDASVKSRALKLLFQTSFDDILHKKILTECIFDTFANLLTDPDTSVVHNAMIALRGLLGYPNLTKRVVETDTTSALWENMTLRFSDEVLKLLALIVKYDDERKALFLSSAISSIKSIITNNRGYERRYALGIMKQALEYDELRKKLLNPNALEAIIGMLEDREESIIDEAAAFLSFATKNDTIRADVFSPSRLSSLRSTPGDPHWPGDQTFIKLLEVSLIHDDIHGAVFDTYTISTIRNLLKVGADQAKMNSIKLLRLCFDHSDICAQIFDADMLATLAQNRKSDDWYTRSQYLSLLTSALDHDHLREMLFGEEAILILRKTLTDKRTLNLLMIAVKCDDLRMKIFDSDTILRFREQLRYRNAGQSDDPQPLLELASNYMDFRQKMFLEDDLKLGDKLGRSESEPRREARRLLAVVARYEELRNNLLDQDLISTIKRLLLHPDRNDIKGDTIELLAQIVEYSDQLHPLLDEDAIAIVHRLLLRSNSDIREKAILFLDTSLKQGKFRMALFDDTLFENLVDCFREGGPYKLDNLDVQILGIALRYEDLRERIINSELPLRFRNAFIHRYTVVQSEALKVLAIAIGYVELHNKFFDDRTIEFIEDMIKNSGKDHYSYAIKLLRAALAHENLYVKLFTPETISMIPHILQDDGNLNVGTRMNLLQLLKDLTAHDGLRSLVFGPEVVSSIVALIPSTSPVVEKYAFEIIEDLVASDEHRQFIFGTKAMYEIPGKLHSNSAPTRLMWLRLLQIAVQYPELRRRLFLNTVLSSLQMALTHEDVTIVHQATELITSMADDNDIREQVLDLKTIGVLEAYQAHPSEGLQVFQQLTRFPPLVGMINHDVTPPIT